MNIEIANRLIELRKQKGYSQEALAQELGISRQAVSKWERAESSPDTDNLICLAKLYGVSLDDLLETSSSIEEIKEEQIKKEESINLKKEEDNDEDEDDYDNDKDYGKVHRIVNAIFPLLAVITFLLLGFLGGWWHPGWVVFLLIPVVPSLVAAIKEKNANLFAYPVFITFLYVLLSTIYSMWHPLWILYLTIPVYYGICNAFKNKDK